MVAMQASAWMTGGGLKHGTPLLFWLASCIKASHWVPLFPGSLYSQRRMRGKMAYYLTILLGAEPWPGSCTAPQGSATGPTDNKRDTVRVKSRKGFPQCGPSGEEEHRGQTDHIPHLWPNLSFLGLDMRLAVNKFLH